MDDMYAELIVRAAMRLNESGMRWYLIGSTGLVLRDLNIGREPKNTVFAPTTGKVYVSMTALRMLGLI